MAGNEYVAKLYNPPVNGEEKQFLYIHSRWREGEITALELQIQDSVSGKIYEGREEDVCAIAQELGITPALFVKECQDALKTNIGVPTFDYKLCAADPPNPPRFQLKKSSEFDIIYLDIPLREVAGCYHILDTAIALLVIKQEQIVASNEAQESADALAALWKVLKEKDQQERKLLKRFTLLLQEKKQRIVELEEKLAAATNTNEQSAPSDDGNEQLAMDTEPFTP